MARVLSTSCSRSAALTCLGRLLPCCDAQYLWRTEKLDIRPEDVKRRIKYHNSIKATIEREGKNEIVKFRRGDKIW